MKRILSSGALAAVLAFAATNAMADKVKVGFMLPYSGTYAALGQAIENGFKLYVQEQGGTLAGQELEYYKVHDESNPAKRPENANRPIKRDKIGNTSLRDSVCPYGEVSVGARTLK